MTDLAERTAQFTPGPWKYERARFGGGWNVLQDHEDETWLGELWTNEADARLIAAAPDLLVAAKALIGWIDGRIGTDTKSDLAMHSLRMQMAINKAEGRS